MLECNWRRRRNKIPIISASEIDDLAEILVKDYKRKLLEEPQAMNVDDFTEFYMGLNLGYQDLTSDQSILGMIAFEDGITEVYDRRKHSAKYIRISKGTTLIDSNLLLPNKKGRMNFTMLHECAHWWFHKDIYIQPCGQLCWDLDNLAASKKCRSSRIENFAQHAFNTNDDWIEWQADYMASAIVMPKTTFRLAVKGAMKEAGINDPYIVTGVDADLDFYTNNTLPKIISDTFGVSKQAAQIKLKKFKYVVEPWIRKEALYQIKMF